MSMKIVLVEDTPELMLYCFLKNKLVNKLVFFETNLRAVSIKPNFSLQVGF